uniref:Predicted protein n=1 Tax=Hordeum vulgare subsp. vulgare TaxID=112509 RepID=F2ELP3_HORVV|nr:predicted protein [Hordeum vulgare subsp. vulgare]
MGICLCIPASCRTSGSDPIIPWYLPPRRRLHPRAPTLDPQGRLMWSCPGAADRGLLPNLTLSQPRPPPGPPCHSGGGPESLFISIEFRQP